MKKLMSIFLVLLFCLSSVTILQVSRVEAEHPKELKFGVVPTKAANNYELLANHLSKKIGMPVKIVHSSTNEKTLNNLGKGKTDLAHLGPDAYLSARERYGSKIECIAHGQVNFDPTYTTTIFTYNESGIESLKDLKGRSVVFTEKDTIYGDWMPKAMLLNAGVKLSDLSKYDYIDSFQGAIEAVMNKDFDAGAVLCLVADDYIKQGKIKLLHRSLYIPHCPICINPDKINKRLAKKIQKVIISLDINVPDEEKIIHGVHPAYSNFGAINHDTYAEVLAVIKKAIDRRDYKR